MAIGKAIQSLFRGTNPKANASPSAPAESPWENISIASISKDIPVEIRDGKDGNQILMGNLNDINLSSMSIGRLPGVFTLPVLDCGQHVKVRGYSKNLDPINVSAKVQSSNPILCQLKDLRLVLSAHNRMSNRLPLLNAEGQLFMDNDKWLARPTPCQVLDVSETGARVVSEYCVPDEAPLRLRVELAKGCGASTYRCQIVRAELLEDNTFEYGLLFAQMDLWKQRELIRDMEEAQRYISQTLNG